MVRQQDVEPLTAFIGTLAAMGEAARYTGGGMRTVGRRAARAGTSLGGRAVANAVDTGRRAGVAVRVFRNVERTYRRPPVEYVAAGVVVGWTGAFAFMALGRAVLRPRDGKPGTTRPRGLDSMRAMMARTTGRRSSDAPPDEPGEGLGSAGVTTIPVPASGHAPDPAVVAQAVGRRARHTTGAAGAGQLP
jgi:hypothetical protein